MILPKYVHFNGQLFSSVSEKLSFNPHFFRLNAKIDFFEEKMVLSYLLSNLNAGGNKLV